MRGPATRSGQVKCADGVSLHDQRLDLVADLQLLEVLDPPLRPEQRVVRAEQIALVNARCIRSAAAGVPTVRGVPTRIETSCIMTSPFV